METATLKKFAQFARRNLMAQVSAKLNFVLAEDSTARRETLDVVESLEEAIDYSGREQVVERVAYIWFNRFCALRFMDVNHYSRVGVVSPADGQSQPEILAEAKMGHIDEDMVGNAAVRERVFGLLQGKITSNDAQAEAYRLLLVAVCNYWNKAMPFMFERIHDYAELLMLDDLLSESSILAQTREAMTPENCEDVEVIGWLYQFYISEKKDAVFEGLKKNKKVTPENIPAATQLFTPHWIVRYLVENSLGRLWMLNRPNSKLAEKMDYYIPPVDSGEVGSEKWEAGSKDESFHSPLSTSHLRISSPEEIRICDPACGSGHMLTYAFDLLYAIYEEEGYTPSEIPEKMLTHNLYGVEIDERAGSLAAFALTMKARGKQRGFFRKPVQPRICVLQNTKFTDDELARYMDFIGRDLFTTPLVTALHQFEEADNFGSLIRPEITDAAGMRKVLAAKDVDRNLLLQSTHQKVLRILEQSEYLSPRYHVVIANPPYMGGKGMNGSLGAWAKDHYPNSKSDLFAMFMERNLELVKSHGMVAMITMQSWMFLSSFESLRAKLTGQNTILSMAHLGARAFNSIGGEVVSTTAFVFENAGQLEFKGDYLRLVDGKSEGEKSANLLEAIRNPQCGWFFRASAADFKKIPGSPIAYWVSPQVGKAFQDNKPIAFYFPVNPGIRTGKDEWFLRLWFEVSQNCTLIKLRGPKQMAPPLKWFPLHKGGNFRKWYGNAEHVIDLWNDAENIKTKSPDFRLRDDKWYFKPFVSWSRISSADIAFRYFPEGVLFSDAGPGIFAEENCIEVMSFLNSKLSNLFLKIINPTLNYQKQDIEAVPFLRLGNPSEIAKVVEHAKIDWDSSETSWDFIRLPLLNPDYRQPTLKTTYQKLRAHWLEMTLKMQHLEEENNRIFIDAYGLQEELTPDVPLKEITLTCNPHYRYGIEEWEVGSEKWEAMEARLLQDTMKELVSYAVGCMFGRYALEKPGLILANQGETLADFVRKVGSEKWEVESEGGNNGDGSKLQRVDCLAEGDGLGGIGLSGDQTISEGGTLRTDQSSQTISGFHSVQHSGRSGQKIDSGVQKFSVNSTGFQSRGRNAVSDRSTTGLYSTGERRSNPESGRGNKAHDLRAKSEIDLTSTTSHFPLPTSHFLPDDDNVIPMLDGDWFTDDITERFRQFLRVTFGNEHYEENLAFIEKAIGKDIRKYFIKDFYNDHVKRYKKRPIYWLFSSPKGSFNALIYMHRYRPDTVSVVLNDYLREFRTKLAAHKNHLEAVSISGSASQSEKTKALKEIDKIKKMIAEMEEYEREVLYPLAARKIEIDLDDGVKTNYPKFGAALKKIPGLDAKEE